ncbi:uncharacterized protein LOC104869210 [Fukomys damarensis]|uniref:uncharacterized protein LOC104869210 n=1 Tax=Fukomys damarensis TaxID=885580 RepID=UPI00053FA8C7|nr:uncharacterized protein LOC104869210 [Fukomys damarensis]
MEEGPRKAKCPPHGRVSWAPPSEGERLLPFRADLDLLRTLEPPTRQAQTRRSREPTAAGAFPAAPPCGSRRRCRPRAVIAALRPPQPEPGLGRGRSGLGVSVLPLPCTTRPLPWDIATGKGCRHRERTKRRAQGRLLYTPHVLPHTSQAARTFSWVTLGPQCMDRGSEGLSDFPNSTVGQGEPGWVAGSSMWLILERRAWAGRGSNDRTGAAAWPRGAASSGGSQRRGVASCTWKRSLCHPVKLCCPFDLHIGCPGPGELFWILAGAGPLWVPPTSIMGPDREPREPSTWPRVHIPAEMRRSGARNSEQAQGFIQEAVRGPRSPQRLLLSLHPSCSQCPRGGTKVAALCREGAGAQ